MSEEPYDPVRAENEAAAGVRLFPTYRWHCQRCGTPNYVDAHQLTDDEVRSALVDAGELVECDVLPDELSGSMARLPSHVRCMRCAQVWSVDLAGSLFHLADADEDDDDDDGDENDPAPA